MPCLDISTNVNLEGVDTDSLFSDATQAVASIIGKPESAYIMELTGSYNDPVPNEFDTSDIYANDEVDHAKELVFGKDKGKGNANDKVVCLIALRNIDEVDRFQELLFAKGIKFKGIYLDPVTPVPEEVDISEMNKAYDEANSLFGFYASRFFDCFDKRIRVKHMLPREQALNCPKCNSTITKYCSYDTFSQGRYFCKTCRINYWSGCQALRSIPDGGGSRMNKRSSSSSWLSFEKLPDLVLPPSTSTHNHENSPGADENAHMILDSICQRMRLSLLTDPTLAELILDMKENKGKEAKDPSSSGGYSGGEDLLGEFPSCPHCPFTRNFKFDNSRSSCADERGHDMIKDGVGLSQSPPPAELPQDIRIDIPNDVENRTVSSLDCTSQEIDSQEKVAKVILAITGEGAFALMNSPSSPVLPYIVAANAVGFVGTLIAILFRRRMPLAAGLAGKVGAIAAAAGIIGAMGLSLTEKFLWTTGLACLIPAMAVVFA